MKTILFLILMGFTMALTAQDENLPEAVKAAFDAKYTKVSGLEWRTDDGEIYKLEFYRAGIMFSCLFDRNGLWIETSEIIADTDIPLKLQSYLHSTFPDASISYAEKVETSDSRQFYRVNMIENDQEFVVKSDINGVVLDD